MNIIIKDSYINEYGSSIWKILHMESFKIFISEINGKNVSEDDIKELIYFFKYIISKMMCECKSNAKRIAATSFFPTSGAELFKWTIDFHNFVNWKLGKPQYSYYNVFVDHFKYCISLKNTDFYEDNSGDLILNKI